jgi:hypothetical protein
MLFWRDWAKPRKCFSKLSVPAGVWIEHLSHGSQKQRCLVWWQHLFSTRAKHYCHNSGHYHRPGLYLKHGVSDTGFGLRLRMESTQLGPADKASLVLRNIKSTWVGSTWRRRQNRVRNCVSNKRTMDNAQNCVGCVNIPSLQTCTSHYWTRSVDVMCLLWGTNIIRILNKRLEDG